MQIYKRGAKLEQFLAAISRDEGLVAGMVRSFHATSRRLVVGTRTPAGPKDVAIDLPADAAIECDGAASPAAEALAPGRFVNVFLARPLTVHISSR